MTNGKKLPSPDSPILIRKYANRRLYDTYHSCYIALSDIRELIRKETPFKVVDARSGADITRSALTQIILEAESSGDNVLSLHVLMRLARVYSDRVERMFLPGYLDESLKWFTKQQDEMREQMEKNLQTYNPFQEAQNLGNQSMTQMMKAMSMMEPANLNNAPDSVPESSERPPGQSSTNNSDSQPDKAQHAHHDGENVKPARQRVKKVMPDEGTTVSKGKNHSDVTNDSRPDLSANDIDALHAEIKALQEKLQRLVDKGE